MHLLVELHGQPGWVAALTPLSVDGKRSGGVRSRPEGAQSAGRPGVRLPDAGRGPAGRGREAQLLAWQWALANQSGDGALPSGRDIGRQHGRHERWGRLVKRSGLAGELDPQT
jgi:hypothetical protein